MLILFSIFSFLLLSLLIFMHSGMKNTKVSYPNHLDLSRPEIFGLYATRNFHLRYSDSDENKVTIAAWHILPSHIARIFHHQFHIDSQMLKNLSENNSSDAAKNLSRKFETLINHEIDINDDQSKEIFFEEILKTSDDPVILYFHGNTGTRANGHRVDLYKALRKLGYHIITIDYRGFADSSDQSPTEKGCVSDALALYKYIKKLTNNPIYVYGHSLGDDDDDEHKKMKIVYQHACVTHIYIIFLYYFHAGTGISLHMMSIIAKYNNIGNPNGVILESPFNNLKDEVANHPFSAVRNITL